LVRFESGFFFFQNWSFTYKGTLRLLKPQNRPAKCIILQKFNLIFPNRWELSGAVFRRIAGPFGMLFPNTEFKCFCFPPIPIKSQNGLVIGLWPHLNFYLGLNPTGESNIAPFFGTSGRHAILGFYP